MENNNIKSSPFGIIDYSKLLKTLGSKLDQKPNESYKKYLERKTDFKVSQDKLENFKQKLNSNSRVKSKDTPSY